MCERNADIFLFNQILFIDFRFVCFDLGSSLIAPFILDFKKFCLDNSHQHVFIFQKLRVVRNLLQEFLILVFNLLFFQTLQSAQLHVKDCLRLDFRKSEALHQSFLCIVVAASDNFYNFVDIIKRDSVTL